MEHESHPRTERHGPSYFTKTYRVTIIMLIIGQLQVFGMMGIEKLKEVLAKYYYLSLFQFFLSFLSLQLYVFFYHIIERKATWIRITCALLTYESNTLCVMKPTKSAPNLSLILSLILVYAMMLFSYIFGRFQVKCATMNRNLLILWSERIFVVTSFGIIVCAEMQRLTLELTSLIVYTLISNVFVVVFATSIRHPEFYNIRSNDWMLVGQLYYLNFYALYMSYVWTTAALITYFLGPNFKIPYLNI